MTMELRATTIQIDGYTLGQATGYFNLEHVGRQTLCAGGAFVTQTTAC